MKEREKFLRELCKTLQEQYDALEESIFELRENNKDTHTEEVCQGLLLSIARDFGLFDGHKESLKFITKKQYQEIADKIDYDSKIVNEMNKKMKKQSEAKKRADEFIERMVFFKKDKASVKELEDRINHIQNTVWSLSSVLKDLRERRDELKK